MDDALALIDRARQGDRDAMESVLESVAPSIRRFALGMCRNDADADDVVQDALLSIATNLGSFEGRSAFATWAFTLARTACSRRRSAASRLRQSARYVLPQPVSYLAAVQAHRHRLDAVDEV